MAVEILYAGASTGEDVGGTGGGAGECADVGTG